MPLNPGRTWVYRMWMLNMKCYTGVTFFYGNGWQITTQTFSEKIGSDLTLSSKSGIIYSGKVQRCGGEPEIKPVVRNEVEDGS